MWRVEGVCLGLGPDLRQAVQQQQQQQQLVVVVSAPAAWMGHLERGQGWGLLLAKRRLQQATVVGSCRRCEPGLHS
jgi:hypothetical protein